jgi:hypothetical protein
MGDSRIGDGTVAPLALGVLFLALDAVETIVSLLWRLPFLCSSAVPLSVQLRKQAAPLAADRRSVRM